MPEQGGDPACWLHQVCDTCGRLHGRDDPCVVAAAGTEAEPEPQPERPPAGGAPGPRSTWSEVAR